MGHATDFLYLKMKEMKVKQKNIKVDDLAEELQKNLKITNNQCRRLQIDDQPLDPVTEDGKTYSQMKKMSQAKDLYTKRKRNKKANRSGKGITTGNESVDIGEKKHISGPQAARITKKIIARNRIPVTHDEEKDEIIIFDSIIPEVMY